MVTVNSILGTRDADKGEAEFEFKGLSTDVKPTKTFGGSKVGENSLFLELDTGDAYYLNGGSWKLFSSSGSGGGAGLPEVTSEDNGKVLGVVDGAWGVKTDESGTITVDDEITENGTNPVTGGAIYDALETLTPFVVEFTATESGGSISVSTTTLVTEILAAKAAGRDVVGTVDLGAYIQEFPLTAYGPGLSGDGLVGFGGVIPDSGDQKSSFFSVQGDADLTGGVETDSWQLFIN